MIVTVILLVGLLGAAVVIGQAVLRMMGCRHWTWLAPSVGLAVMVFIATATEFIPGGALTSFVALRNMAGVVLWGEPGGGRIDDVNSRHIRAGSAVRVSQLVVVLDTVISSVMRCT